MAEGEENKKTIQFLLAEIEELKRQVGNLNQIKNPAQNKSFGAAPDVSLAIAIANATGESISSALKSSLETVGKMIAENRERDLEMMRLNLGGDDDDPEESGNGADKGASMDKAMALVTQLIQSGALAKK